MVLITLSGATMTLRSGSPEGVKLRSEALGPLLQAETKGASAMP